MCGQNRIVRYTLFLLNSITVIDTMENAMTFHEDDHEKCNKIVEKSNY